MTGLLDPDLQEEMDALEGDDFPEEENIEVSDLIDKILLFGEMIVGHGLHAYQEPFARRIIETVLLNDGEEVTGLASRQSGKTETISNVVATLMVVLPRLATMYPEMLGMYKDGFWVGMFAPVQGQVETMFNRTANTLNSERAKAIMGDPEIDDKPTKAGSVVRTIRLAKSGSLVSMMTANPRAKIESRTFHLIVIDEAQDSDDFTVIKSIKPMLAYHAGSMVKSGTPTTKKGNFYRSIQLNKRNYSAKRGAKKNHYEWDWKAVAKVNPNYGKFIQGEIRRYGEDSDEFRMSYACQWILERGMFTSQAVMEELGDTSMNVVRNWSSTPVVVGVDPARKTDSTVVTVVWVDWDRPDEYGLYDHRILNWLELQGDDWEEQFAKIVDFLSTYNVYAINVDANGVGDVVAQRLKVLVPRAEVVSATSSQQEQSKRYKHLMTLMERRLIGWPAHYNTRRTRIWRKFTQQMLDAEKVFKGPNFTVKAPEEAGAHDDFVDSLALACALTEEFSMPTVEVSQSPFWT